MADKRKYNKREGQIKAVKSLMDRVNGMITKEEIVEKDLTAILKNLTLKQSSIIELDEQIQASIDDEKEMSEDIQMSTDVNIAIESCIFSIHKALQKSNPTPIMEDNTSFGMGSSSSHNNKKAVVKLPKLTVKSFYGDPTNWQEFIDTFNVAIHENEDLSPIEKFTYLKGYIGGDAAKSLEGLKLTSSNYEHAREILEERFGQKQVIIGKHMNNLLDLPRVKSSYQVKELRALYDKITVNIRGLSAYDVSSKQFSPMLVPIIMQKLPQDIKLELSKSLKKKDWNLDEIVELFKSEIEARESCCNEVDHQKDQNQRYGNNKSIPAKSNTRLTTENLLATSETKNVSCRFCKQNHYSDKCTVVTDLAARREIIISGKLCFRCFSPKHAIRNCRSNGKCFKCSSNRHHTSICDQNKVKFENSNDVKGSEKCPETDDQVSMVTGVSSNPTSVILQTAKATVCNTAESQRVKVRILLDPGSQRSYITEELASVLKLNPIARKVVTIKAFGDQNTKPRNVNEYSCCIVSQFGMNLYVNALAVPTICSNISGQRIDIVAKDFNGLRGVNIDAGEGSGSIDLLIGSDFYWSIVNGEVRRCGKDGLVAISSKLGWIFSGPLNNSNDREEITAANLVTHVMRVELQEHNQSEIRKDLDKFWELDSLGIVEHETSVYDKFVKQIELKDDRYQVRLPFKENHTFIEDNYRLSLSRLTKLKSKLSTQPSILKEYDDVIRNQLQMGVIEEAPSPGEVGRVTYLPHRAVIRDDKVSTKVRVVFDASAKNKGPSLNDCLYKGPCLNPLLFDMLLRFRLYPIAITADIKQAFLQISVHPDERDYLRFLWFDDVFSENPKLVIYRFNRVIFGATCSQFLLNGAIKLHLERYKHFDPEFIKKILKCFYIDDLNTGVDSVKQGIELYKKLKGRFSEAKMDLCQWRTNNEELRQKMSGDPIPSEVSKKVLGIRWNEVDDELVLDVNEFLSSGDVKGVRITKKHILSVVASFYDPIGYIQPIVITLKIFFQEICKNDYKWDDILSAEHIKRWKLLMDDIYKMEVICLPRYYGVNQINDPYVSVELVGFSDASPVAYGCCIYFKFIH